MNFFFRKLFSNHIKPEEEGDFLVRLVSGSAFSVFSDEQFRRMINFEKRKQIEQDRIFNELVVTGLILLLMMINDFLPDIDPERKQFWHDIKEGIPDLFVNWLKEVGVGDKFAGIWKKLIYLRWDEYKKEQSATRRMFLGSALGDIQNEAFKDAAVRVETTTVGSLLYITRGNAKPRRISGELYGAKLNDPLRKHLCTWLSTLNHKLETRVGW